MKRTGRPLRVSFLLLLISTGACRKATVSTRQAAAPAPRRVESTALGIALAGVPAGFTIAPAAGEALRLERGDGGTLILFRGTDGQTAAVRAEAARIGALPGGRYLGSIELLCQLGRAYLTRGQYQDKGKMIEEMRIFAAHPRAPGRCLILSSTYPAATAGRERVDQALAVLAKIEAWP